MSIGRLITCNAANHVRVLAMLWVGLYTPRDWPSFAQNLAQLSVALTGSTSNSTAKRFVRPITRPSPLHASLSLKRDTSTNSSDPATDYAYQAITCADAVDAGNTTTRDGFDAVVNVTQNNSRMCEFCSCKGFVRRLNMSVASWSSHGLVLGKQNCFHRRQGTDST
jgi:hypothetical protein